MGRLGSRFAQSAVFSLALGQDEPPYEPYKGQFSMQMLDEPDKMMMPIADFPSNNFYTMASTKNAIEKMKKDKLKLRDNKDSEIEIKMPKRVEGLRFAATLQSPAINIGDEPDYSYLMPYKLNEMTDSEQVRVATIFPKNPPANFIVGEDEKMSRKIAKVEDTYQIDDLNNQEQLEFIQTGKGKYFTEMSDNNAIDELGSTIKENTIEIMNKPLVAKTGFELYKESMEPVTKSRVQDRQMNNMKSRQILNLYSGQPSQPPTTQTNSLNDFLKIYEQSKRIGIKG